MGGAKRRLLEVATRDTLYLFRRRKDSAVWLFDHVLIR